jgi:hypothetical protein
LIRLQRWLNPLPAPRAETSRVTSRHPPEPFLVHPLPPAPQFVGREAELEGLRASWSEGSRGVLALVGLGGAGKTAVASRFLDELLGRRLEPGPGGLFVWSFYQEPDAGLFLERAYHYFAGGGAPATPARGAALLHLLGVALDAGGPHLIVLDGLERVQRQEGDHAGRFGQVEDPLLRGFLSRAAEGIGRTTALVTSRFPLTDLEPYQDRGYRHLAVEGLDLAAAVALLRRRGVHGDDPALAGLIESYGAHALTLDHLGGLIGQFLGGDPRRAPEAPALASPGGDRQALRLARLLHAYEEHLPPGELTLLCRLCLLPRSVKDEQIVQLFVCSPPVQVWTAREVVRQVRTLPASDVFPTARRDELAEAVSETVKDVLREATIAGPEGTFREEICRAVADAFVRLASGTEERVEELIRLYSGAGSIAPDTRRPLPARDQEWLRRAIARYQALRSHPLFPYKEPPAQLEYAFLKEGWAKPIAREGEDMGPADILSGFLRQKKILHSFVVKHFALVRVREVCALRQRKWALAGALATLDAAGLRRAVEALVGRHLLVREADGAVGAHPAVRDYFARLGSSAEQGGWHEVVGEQLIRLAQRPGLRLPEDKATLDLLEDAIHHALRAGRTEKALGLYNQALGGHRHLAWKLGESARGQRILRGFSSRPDRWALGWYLRALGELEEAYLENTLSYFRADVRLLQGRLAQVAAEGDSSRSAVADALRGLGPIPAADPLGLAVPRAQLLLYAGQVRQAWQALGTGQVYGSIGWEGDRARCRLLRAEAARRMAQVADARKALDESAAWILHSGSVEHLCQYHLARARLSLDDGDPQASRRAVDEGLHLARQGGLGLCQVELLCVQAATSLAAGNAPAAEPAARRALELAAAPDCGFLWGRAEANHLLGQSLIAQRRAGEARSALREALTLRRQLGDLTAVRQTEGLLSSLPG